MAQARSIRAMMGDPRAAIRSTSAGNPRDETSAALAAVDVLVHWALTQRHEAREAAGLGAGRRDPRPTQGGGHRRHRHRRWAAVVAAGRERRSNGRQFTAARRGAQGGHQEGADGRFGRRPAARAGGQGRDAARAASDRTTRPPSARRRPPSSSAAGPPRKTDDTEIVLGRNPVVECLRAGVPATALYVALGAEADERLTEAVTRAADSGIAILEVPRTDLDRMSTNGLHQGIALQVPPYDYAHPDDMLRAAKADACACAAGGAWTTSPTRATSVPSCGRWPRSAATGC